MGSPLAICRRLAALLAPWLAMVALTGSLAGAAHHHADGGSHQQCAVCSHGAAPAITAIATALPSAPAAHVERSVLPATAAPRCPCRSTALSRAPPQA